MWNSSQVDGPIAFADDPAYHLNISPLLMTEELEAFRVDPSVPARVFAGDVGDLGWTTVFLRFPDEDWARAVLPTLWID